MAESLGVTPPELRATARHLDEVSGRMKAVLSCLRQELAAEGAPWGDHPIGVQFANGDSGYLAQLSWVEASVEAKTGLLDFYAQGLQRAADSFEQHDQA